eukprot:364912-Chlamydomonas_euryale.AAC.9
MLSRTGCGLRAQENAVKDGCASHTRAVLCAIQNVEATSTLCRVFNSPACNLCLRLDSARADGMHHRYGAVSASQPHKA